MLRCGFVFVLAASVLLVSPTTQTAWGQALTGSIVVQSYQNAVIAMLSPPDSIETVNTATKSFEAQTGAVAIVDRRTC